MQGAGHVLSDITLSWLNRCAAGLYSLAETHPMQRVPCLLLTALAACAAHAHLNPDRPALLAQHLIEVNAQWPHMAPSLLDDPRTARFHSDTERIAAHLHLVHDRLVQHTPAGLADAALARRLSLLAALEAYADRGLFPMNDKEEGRSPIFIDDAGTACAVGHLLITSGSGDIAMRIHDTMNAAYIKDIQDGGLPRWAAMHGLTIDELAWVQPTYEFRMQEPQGLASLVLQDGDMLVVHGPDPSDPKPEMTVVRRTASGDLPMGTLPLFAAVRVLERDGHIHIGGTLPTTDVAVLYEWTGKGWMLLQAEEQRPDMPLDEGHVITP